MMPMAIYLFLCVELIMVSYLDLKFRKISNQWPILNIILFAILVFLFPEIYVLSWKTFILPLTFILVGFFLFILKIMGGGDSKFLATLYLLIPLNIQDIALVYLLYTTILVGGSLLFYNAAKNFDKILILSRTYDVMGIKRIFGKKFSYAPVIFIAWVWFGLQNMGKIFW